MVKKYFKARKRSTTRRTTKPWVRSQWTGIKRKLEEGPELPSGPSQKIGRYTPVHPNQTTLSRSLGPFQGKKFVELVYWQTPLLQTTTAGGTFLSVNLNGAL